MKNKKPPFEITPKILSLVTDIAELVGRVSSSNLTQSPTLRRTNRILTGFVNENKLKKIHVGRYRAYELNI